MTLEKSRKLFLEIQGDYAAWLSRVLMSAFYDDVANREEIFHPAPLQSLTDEAIVIPQRVIDSQGILHQIAEKILEEEQKPKKEILDEFLITYQNFQNTLQRLEQDRLLADYGIDAETGMRSSAVMIPDLERELERRERRGQPFCIVLSRIDDSATRKSPEAIALAVAAIEKTIRSFDDAYVSNEGEFLSSLKHSDDKGGLKFVARLNDNLKSNSNVNFTMSSCVAEPLPGDSIPQLIANVRQDLDVLSGQERGAMGQYEDISPLSRYLQSMKKED
jgi:hypothetical protein